MRKDVEYQKPSREERIAESLRQRIRNENTIRITVIENGLIVKEGDKDAPYHIENLDSGIGWIDDFINRREKVIASENENNERTKGTKIRLADRRETVRDIRVGTQYRQKRDKNNVSK